MAGLAFWVAVARGLHLVALLSMFGAAFFRVSVAPLVEARLGGIGFDAFDRRIAHLALASGFVALASVAIWLPLLTAAMTGATGLAEASQSLAIVLFQTHFGHVLLARGVALAVALPAFYFYRRRNAAWLGTLAAGIACAWQAWTGHGGSGEGAILPISEALHVLAAGAWLGGLVPLWLTLDRNSPAALASARRFSFIGMICVVILGVTALLQGWRLIGGIGALFGTDYGIWGLAKAGLFLLLLALAAINLLWLTPALQSGPSGPVTRYLRLSIVLETLLGLAIVFAAAQMATLPPGTHLQPEWPFAWRPSFDAVRYGHQRRELMAGALALASAGGLAAVALFWRRVRWPSIGAAVVVLALAPSLPLNLLFVPANRTSFYHSPTGFTAVSIMHGATLFETHCASCHGGDGRGNLAAVSGTPPDLTGPATRTASDGDLFWSLSQGTSEAMPGFADRLSEEERWNLSDYLRANAAGADVAESDDWGIPTVAPALQTECAVRSNRAATPSGQPIRIVALQSGDSGPAVPAIANVRTIYLARQHRDPIDGECLDASSASWAAYALIAGVSPAALAGTQFLVDGDGWLRAVWRPGEAIGWTSARQSLAQEIAEICSHPINAAGTHHH